MSKWNWRGNQLYDPTSQRTLLRDVTFWNCTEQDKCVIAAAPDLLEALRVLTDNIEHAFPSLAHLGPVTNARAAIAKAERSPLTSPKGPVP